MRFRSFALGASIMSVSLGFTGTLDAQKPRAHGFRLFARALVNLTVNRVECGFTTTGDVCIDGSGYDGLWGGFWPKDSPQNYVFNSGMQIAGVIDSTGGWSWAGDTTGAFFFDPKGTTQHGEQVEPFWDYSAAADHANWPEMAKVPVGDASATLYDPTLQGRASASEGDLWNLAWEGDTALTIARPHPLGVAMETRVLAWNYPGGNRDIFYLLTTFYNITSTCAADYAGVRPELRDELLTLGRRFQAMNNAKYGIQIPVCGYTIHDLYFGSMSDNDVASAGDNYASVNLPLRLRYTYQANFEGPTNGYLLPNDLSDPPFLNGFGFVGEAFLKTPVVGGQEAGIRLFSVSTSGGLFNDPPNTASLYRYLTGGFSAALGDGNCNFDPSVDHVCYLKSDSPTDVRDWASTGPAILAPGGSTTIATAYLFASAVAITDCPVPGCPTVGPGDPRFLSNAAHLLASGANDIDSLAGFTGYVDDNADGLVQGREFRTVRNSLYQKAQLAQTIFDHHFLIPQPPASPDFFLVPGDNKVSVVWRPSPTEQSGDPYFTIASDLASGGYDPNYRRFDVEGYRVYRGRVDDPAKLTLVAQFDYGNHDAAGHTLVMNDFLGTVNSGSTCAPELGHNTIADGCTVNFQTPPPPGVPYTVSTPRPIVSPFIQVRRGDRFFRASGQLFTVAADTAVTGGGSGLPAIVNNDVPFVFVDTTVRNSLRYFYAVAAFDVNSIESGPSSLESARVTKGVTPEHQASNFSSTGGITAVRHVGRGVDTDSLHPDDPTIDPGTGVFSGPARPATGAAMAFLSHFLPQVVNGSGSVSLTLLDLTPGSVYDGVPVNYTLLAGVDTLQVSVAVPVDNASASEVMDFTAIPVSPGVAGRYGGSGGYSLVGAFALRAPGTYLNGGFGRGCVNGNPAGTTTGHRGGLCGYDGARWFGGANESFPDPTRGNGPNGATPAALTNFTNAGSLPGIANAWEPRAYQTRSSFYRAVEGVFATISTAADYRVYWGATPGHVDSVVDLTHNVPLPFDTTLKRGYTWGFLDQSATTAPGSLDGRAGVLTVSDLGCVDPIHTYAAPNAHLGCAVGTTYTFADTAVAGPVAMGEDSIADQTAPPRPNPGFGMYLAGHFFLFELAAGAPLPSGTFWTLRSYTGAIDGGGENCPTCTAGTFGEYQFKRAMSPLTAVGSGLRLQYTAVAQVRPATENDLSRVHTVPDPYYVTNGFETDPQHKVIKFVNLPDRAIVRIYTTSGILVRVLEHASISYQGELDWDLRNSGGRLVANGVYFYAIEAIDARRVGRLTIVSLGR